MRATLRSRRSPARATASVDGSHEGIATRHAENVSCARATAARTSTSAWAAGSSVVDVDVDVDVEVVAPGGLTGRGLETLVVV